MPKQTWTKPQPSSLGVEAPQVITLGRASDNTIVLTGSNVSQHHARLIRSKGKLVLEDLGSTNGTSVGKVENKISRVAIRPSDTIFFGSTAYRVSALLAQVPSVAVPRVAVPRVARQHQLLLLRQTAHLWKRLLYSHRQLLCLAVWPWQHFPLPSGGSR
ncbi:MAG: FHA domain-containing protein [Pirellulaceae bacterium]